MAQAKAQKRLLLIRLLRSCYVSQGSAKQPYSPAQQLSQATQTDAMAQSCCSISPCHRNTAEDWAPLVGAHEDSAAQHSLLRSLSLPISAISAYSARSRGYGQGSLRQELDQAASAPHPIDDILEEAATASENGSLPSDDLQHPDNQAAIQQLQLEDYVSWVSLAAG